MASPLRNRTYRRLFVAQVVALLLPRFLDRLPDRLFMFIGGFVLASGLSLGSADLDLLTLLPVWCLLGAGTSLIQTPAGRLLRRSAVEGDRSALYAAQFALSHACWLLAYPIAGWVGGPFRHTVAFTLHALIALASTLVALVLWPAYDSEEMEHRHEAVKHEHLHVHDAHHQHPHEGWEG